MRRAAALMEKYEDVPMDFADATFIAQVEERQAEHIFTLHRRGFSTYRLHGRKPFAILP